MTDRGPFPPLRLFKHAAHSFESNSKGGVDDATQYRSKLRSAMVVYKWEQRLISQKIKSIVANAFILWRIRRSSDLLEFTHFFKDIESYRTSINRETSMGSFVFQFSPKLVHFAASLSQIQKPKYSEDESKIEPSSNEGLPLFAAVREKNRYRVDFFNSSDGVSLKLRYQPHPQRHNNLRKHCALCRSGISRKRSKFTCAACNVHLCIRIQKDRRKSFWSKRHESKRLEDICLVEKSATSNNNSTPHESDRSQPDWTPSIIDNDPLHLTPTNSRAKSADTIAKRAARTPPSTKRQCTRKATSVSRVDQMYQPQIRTHATVPCDIDCRRQPLPGKENSAHAYEDCSRSMHGLCVYSPDSKLGGSEYEGFAAGGFCQSC